MRAHMSMWCREMWCAMKCEYDVWCNEKCYECIRNDMKRMMAHMFRWCKRMIANDKWIGAYMSMWGRVWYEMKWIWSDMWLNDGTNIYEMQKRCVINCKNGTFW